MTPEVAPLPDQVCPQLRRCGKAHDWFLITFVSPSFSVSAAFAQESGPAAGMDRSDCIAGRQHVLPESNCNPRQPLRALSHGCKESVTAVPFTHLAVVSAVVAFVNIA